MFDYSEPMAQIKNILDLNGQTYQVIKVFFLTSEDRELPMDELE